MKEHNNSPLKKLFFGLLFSVISLCIFSTSVLADSSHKNNILLLSSYHIGYKWSDDIYRGILETLQQKAPSAAIHVEFMDMKRNYSDDRFETLHKSLAAQYGNIKIDYVISSDDTAFIFLKKYAGDLFPNATIIFCGTNYLEQEALADFNNFYGITEKADIEPTFELMLKLHPRTEKIFIINDLTVTGKIVKSHLIKAIKAYQHDVKFEFLDDITMPELLKKVGGLPDNSLLFFTFFFRDSTGDTFEYNESISMIEEHANTPIYGAWDFNLGFGIVGGMLTSGYHQGRAAGQLALRFLHGESQEALPRLSASPNRYLFDYNVLKKNNISLKKLPAGSILINKPETFWERHRKVLLSSAVFIVLLLLIISTLIFNILLRKKAEKNLRQSERNFRGIFENASEGLYQVTLDGKFVKANKALAKILKCDSPEDVLETYADLEHDLHVNPEQRHHIVQQVLEKGSTQMELEVYCKDNTRSTVLLYCHQVVDDKNRLLYLEGSLTDMTEYKMTQEVIIQTEKMVSLGGLSAGIAHEIKNPLSSMIQSSYVISNRLIEPTPANRRSAEKLGMSLDNITAYIKDREIPNLLRNITDSGHRANVIVEDMLSFSKKTIGEFSKESLVSILYEAVDLAKKDYSLPRGYNLNAITFEYSFPDEIPPLYCSPTKLRQVLFNLLKNSAEAMAEARTKDPCIICSIEYDETIILLRLEDNGPGMEKKVKEKIFEPFYSTKGRKKGTGLGLSIAYFIVTENHKGQMHVETSPGEGAAFTLQFPLDSGAPPKKEVPRGR